MKGVYGDDNPSLYEYRCARADPEEQNDTVVVEDERLLENKATADALSNIANLALHNDSIRDISVTYERSDGEREKVCITKTTLTRVAEYSVESEVTNYLQTSVTLEIVSPVFSDAPSIWKVRYNARVLSAKMMDADFLETMGAKGIASGNPPLERKAMLR